MKRLSLVSLLCCVMVGESAIAQRAVAGLFMTVNDFYNQKLSEKSVPGHRHIIRTNEVFYLPFVTVSEGRVKRRYAKDSLFGYLCYDGAQLRFFRRGSYEVLNAGKGLMLYRQTIVAGGKAPQTSTFYYFSKDASAPIQPLSRDALSAAYGDDEAFLTRIYESFPDDAGLAQYDNYHKVYKLVRIYEQTHR